MFQKSNCSLLNYHLPVANAILKMPMQEAKAIKIVLAEDDGDEQGLFAEAIKELQVATKVKIVADGCRLIEYLKQTQIDPPDVIFLDIMMPLKNGLECLREIKNDDTLKTIPIIMYSNSVGEDYIMKTYEYGALYFLQKGKYCELTESISRLLAIINKDPIQGTIEKFRFSLTE